MKKLKKSVSDMVAEARRRITEIPATEAVRLFGNDDVIIVDIRDIRERKNSGYIDGSVHAPRGMLEFWVDPQSPYYKEVFGKEAHYVLHCASGWRSALAAAALQDMGFEASHITEGFSGWVDAGGPIVTDKDD